MPFFAPSLTLQGQEFCELDSVCVCFLNFSINYTIHESIDLCIP